MVQPNLFRLPQSLSLDQQKRLIILMMGKGCVLPALCLMLNHFMIHPFKINVCKKIGQVMPIICSKKKPSTINIT